MKINSQKVIPYLIVIVPLVLVLSVSFFISSFYINKVTNYFATAKENSIKDYVDAQKGESELRVKQLVLLFEYTNNRVEPSIKEELKKEVELAYKIVHKIYKKYKGKKSTKEIKSRIKEALLEIVYNDKSEYVFITNYRANAVLNGSHLNEEDISLYRDADNRAVVLEEVQKVRRHQEGYIYSRRGDTQEKEIVFVKDLGIYDWYIGSSTLVKTEQDTLKKDLLEMVKSIPIEGTDFIGVFEDEKELYMSDMFSIDIKTLTKDERWHKHQLRDYYYFSRYYKEFNWTVVYGFNTKKMSASAQAKHEKLEKMLGQEYNFILKVSAFIVAFIVLLSLFFSLKINSIFKTYQEEVETRAMELEELNDSLEQRVLEELTAHRQKDKMLTQSAKMAEMGDMLSMIAHQWRQPLNQMSYVIMNIESAYEYNELTTEYMEEKVKEANELLEFMSVTIDDFKNYFRPDKELQEVQVEDVIQTAISLIKKTLDSESIELVLAFQAESSLKIYRNEFIQVILNLMKNSRDALLSKENENKQITIRTIETSKSIVISVSDNAGGIKDEIIDKIFEPYFSTKDQKSGTGLGLYMSKMIIEGHLGGRIMVSNLEEGACFSIDIPIG